MTVAALCVALTVPVISADAFGRYLFRAPVPWAFELVTYYLLVCAIYFALCSTYRHGDHININLIQKMLPRSVRTWLEVVYSALGAAIFTLLAYGAWTDMVDAFRGNEFIPGYIMWPVWLSFLPIPIGSMLLVLRLLHHSGMLIRRGKDPFVASGEEEILL